MSHSLKTDNELLSQLRSLTSNLLWMSEADYPFEVFIWDEKTITPEQLKAKTGHNLDIPIEVKEIDKFFKQAVKEEDWHNEEEKTEVKQYQLLLKMLKQNLNNIQVYRLGKVEVDIYIIGVTASGHLAGISTKAVET